MLLCSSAILFFHFFTSLLPCFFTSVLLYFSTSLFLYFFTSLLLYFSTSLLLYFSTSLFLYFSAVSLLLVFFASLLLCSSPIYPSSHILSNPNSHSTHPTHSFRIKPQRIHIPMQQQCPCNEKRNTISTQPKWERNWHDIQRLSTVYLYTWVIENNNQIDIHCWIPVGRAGLERGCWWEEERSLGEERRGSTERERDTHTCKHTERETERESLAEPFPFPIFSRRELSAGPTLFLLCFICLTLSIDRSIDTTNVTRL